MDRANCSQESHNVGRDRSGSAAAQWDGNTKPVSPSRRSAVGRNSIQFKMDAWPQNRKRKTQADTRVGPEVSDSANLTGYNYSVQEFTYV